jgi:hypothetical protein
VNTRASKKSSAAASAATTPPQSVLDTEDRQGAASGTSSMFDMPDIEVTEGRQGASRADGGILMGNAVGNATNMADIPGMSI